MSRRFSIALIVGVSLLSVLGYRAFFNGDGPSRAEPTASTELQGTKGTRRVAESTVSPTLADRVEGELAVNRHSTIGPPISSPSMGVSDGGVRLSIFAPTAVRRGSSFSVAINADASRPVNRCTFVIRFNPLTVKAVAGAAGTFMEQGSALAKVSSSVDPERGVVEVEVQQDGGQGVEGSGSIVAIEFEALATGTADLRLVQSDIADGNGHGLEVSTPAFPTMTIYQ